MSALRWAAVPLVAGVLTGNVAVAVAAADDPPPAPTPTPTATPDPTSTSTPESDSTPLPSETGSVVYLTTVTTTTTIVNAPITVVAAPITTTINSPNGAADSARARLVLNLTGCGGPGGRSPTAQHIERAHVRLARDASLIVRVNGRRITTLRLPATAPRHRRGVALRLRLAPSGTLTIRRPSGRILAVQGCTPA